MVEFIFVAPVLCLLLFGIIDFGLILSDDIGLKQGVREAARQGAVGEFGSAADCPLFAGGTDEMKRLACLTKDRSDMNQSKVRVAIRLADPENDTLIEDPQAGKALLVCATAPMESRTGFFSALMGGRHVQSKVVMRIEVAEGLASFKEPDTSGGGWAWCQP